jgi:hypothetical protein
LIRSLITRQNDKLREERITLSFKFKVSKDGPARFDGPILVLPNKAH